MLTVTMSSKTSLFRTSKTRNSRSQQQLRSNLLAYKQSSYKHQSKDPQYHQTYGIDLPDTSVKLLQPVINAFTGAYNPVNKERRELFTVTLLREGTDVIYRCCFIQPEIASAACSFAAAWKPTVNDVLVEITDQFPDATPCTLSTAQRYPQLSGRMVPYVVEFLPHNVNWGFVNICKSYMLFIRTDEHRSLLMAVSRECMKILTPFFPDYSACVFDSKTSSYKITVTPEQSVNMNEPNKNSCMYIYGDGSFRLQGHPDRLPRVCESFRNAIIEISKSVAWTTFTSKLIVVPQVQTDEKM